MTSNWLTLKLISFFLQTNDNFSLLLFQIQLSLRKEGDCLPLPSFLPSLPPSQVIKKKKATKPINTYVEKQVLAKIKRRTEMLFLQDKAGVHWTRLVFGTGWDVLGGGLAVQ